MKLRARAKLTLDTCGLETGVRTAAPLDPPLGVLGQCGCCRHLHLHRPAAAAAIPRMTAAPGTGLSTRPFPLGK